MNRMTEHLDGRNPEADRRDRVQLAKLKELAPDVYEAIRNAPTTTAALNLLGELEDRVIASPSISPDVRTSLLSYIVCLAATYESAGAGPKFERLPDSRWKL